ncbi:hypothetical protein AJ80_03715 [Polytolypa hystricis UAMH7299]|uniref:Uncharacterized protein n=1 Tax=Polytolypa hystricis (strain UAMH7299) TaxID=1447883 RepID=A0A2B7YFL8_POLH7|nr:hypothetical protein AJ80_03715 [Polytolypa hystricis UAMH7299]
MILIKLLVAVAPLLYTASARAVDTSPGLRLFARQLAGVVGYSQCARAKGEACREAITNTRCTTPDINAELPAIQRWNSVFAREAWENLTIWYQNEGRGENSLPFTRWMVLNSLLQYPFKILTPWSNKFHQEDNMDCQSLADNNGCSAMHLCKDEYSAGFLILNSFETLNNLLWNYYDSLYHAKSDIESIVPALTSTFALMDNGLPTAAIIDMVALGFVVTAAPIWNLYTRGLPSMRQAIPGRHKHGRKRLLKDTVNGIVTQGLTLTKDLTKAQANLAAERDFSTRLGAMVEIWAESASEFAKNIFSGHPTEIGRLGKLVKLVGDGKLSQTPFGASGTGEDLIPRSWRLSNLPIGAFILKSNKNCGAKVGNISEEQRKKCGVCINGEQWIITSAPDPGNNCRYYGDTYSCLEDFHDVPSADQLGGREWGGLSVEDIVRGAVATWDMHGHKNNGKVNINDATIVRKMEMTADPAAKSPENSFFEQVRPNVVCAPGIIDLPVCAYKEAVKNWEKGFGTVNWKLNKNYPCNG